MSIIVKGNILSALKPGVNRYWSSYEELPGQFMNLFDMYTSDEAFEEEVQVTEFTSVPEKDETSPVVYTSNQQSYTTRYNHRSYALGFIVSKEAMQDYKYYPIVMKNTPRLGNALMRTKDIVGSNIYNRGFTAGFNFGDGTRLIHDAHPTNAGNQSNLGTSAALSEASLEDMVIAIHVARDHDGNYNNLMEDCLVVPPDLQFEAERILHSSFRSSSGNGFNPSSGTAVIADNNDINAMKNMGKFPGGVKINKYLTSQSAYFIRTNAEEGLKYFSRNDGEFSQDHDFDAETHKFKIFARFSFGCTNWRAIWGNVGT